MLRGRKYEADVSGATVNNLQQHFNVATVTELIRANTVLRQAKKLVLINVLNFVSINWDQATLIFVMEASFAGHSKGSSQMDLTVPMSTGKIIESFDTANIIERHSKKIHRIVKSTLAAEIAAISFEFDKTFFAREIFTEIMFGRDRKRKDVPPIITLSLQLTAESGLTQDLSFLVGRATDCIALYDVGIHPTSMPTEKRDTLDLLDVCHHLEQHPAMCYCSCLTKICVYV